MSAEWIATYRLQLHAGFPLAAAQEALTFLAQLGISHVYLSPAMGRYTPAATRRRMAQLLHGRVGAARYRALCPVRGFSRGLADAGGLMRLSVWAPRGVGADRLKAIATTT
jgi:hypothetical protein